MKIIDRLKQCWNPSGWKEAIENIEDIDYTQFEDTEIFEALKPALESNWMTFGPVKVKHCLTTVGCDKVFADGNIYPVICFIMEVFYDGVVSVFETKIYPFGCLAVSGNAPYGNNFKKNISIAVGDFMKQKFESVYYKRKREYFNTIKDLKISKAKQEADAKIREAENVADEKIRQAEKEFEEIINDI